MQRVVRPVRVGVAVTDPVRGEAGPGTAGGDTIAEQMRADVAAVVNSDVAGYGDTLMYGQNNGAQSAFVTVVDQNGFAPAARRRPRARRRGA